MRNIEIKARIADYDNVCKIAEKLSGGPPTVMKQDDTFFIAPNGRLKLRFNGDSTATLVRYNRDDEEGPKLSDYDLLQFSASELDKAKMLHRMLKASLGQCGRVVKERKLYMVGQTRVHVDTVLGLGYFMELEVVMREDQSVEEGKQIASDLQKELGVQDFCLISCAYVDLLDMAS